jgi:hypothetical protein
VGVVGLGVGTYFGLRTLSDKSDATSGPCDANNRCTQQGVNELDEAHTFATISTIGFAVGAVGAATAVVLLLTDSQPKTSGRAQVYPLLGAHTGGLAIQAPF